MPGLDRRIIDAIDHESVLAHVKSDVRSDFILAPHYNAVFSRAQDDLWEIVRQQLRAGSYNPELPLTISVPKERYFTRPGSILRPVDRFVYQALIDHVIDEMEETIDRTRAFSHVPSNRVGRMFETGHTSWGNFQEKIAGICEDSAFVLKSDIANYFERIPQHHLVNLMTAADCAPEVVKLLEEMLLAFRERNSFGIIQGLFPSDALGNFYLSDLDAYCELSSVDSARYVDDTYMGFATEVDARRGLAELIDHLRKSGLHLNEFKSRIMPAEEVIQEETAIDRLFDEIRAEVEGDDTYARESPYGFGIEWEDDESEDPDNDGDDVDLENAAVERLMANIGEYPGYEDQIEKFCLPILRSAASDSALDYVMQKIVSKPHQNRMYFGYIIAFMNSNAQVVQEVERLVSNDAINNYQRMLLLAALLKASSVRRETINIVLNWLQNPSVAKETRAMAAAVAAKHGSAQQKRVVRTSYENEPSDYVRSAILYSSKFFTSTEKRTCKIAWGGHSVINSLIVKTI